LYPKYRVDERRLQKITTARCGYVISHHVIIIEFMTTEETRQKSAVGKLVAMGPAKLALGAVMLSLIVGTFYLRKAGYISPESVMGFLEEHRALAPAVFILVYAIMPSLLLPTLPMSVGAGFLWGPLWGTVLSVVGATSGFTISFLVSRYIAGDYFRTKFDFVLWKWLMEHVEKSGWKVVAFTRINPIFPAAVCSYLFGVTSVRFIDYVWATFVFIIPPCIAIASFGSSLGDFVLTGDMKGVVTKLAIASLALLFIFALKPLAKKLLPEKEKVD
jgi:uncharacterized membrane protein YdjX (TVP38/TMEM64 family)